MPLSKKLELKYYDAVIFDVDGTLIDSMGVWERVDYEFLGRRGLAVPDDYVRTIRSMTFRETATYTIDRFGLRESEEAIMAEWLDMARHEYAELLPFKRGAIDYVRELSARGIKLATATSLSRDLLRPVLTRGGIYDLFDAHCLTEECGTGKESPEIFIIASGRLGTSPDRCVVFEDILPAVRAAKSAGMTVVAVRDGASLADEAALRDASDSFIDDFTEAPR